MPTDALLRGYELEGYSIESVLGSGSFGITYLARDSKLGARVAIKEYFPQDLARRNEQMTIYALPGEAAERFAWGREQFLEEARVLAQFKHNNIVRVLRFLELNGTAYMVMEYEEGQGFLDYIQSKGQPDERMLLQVFLPILNGLQAVHSARLLHLDIKPDNIYLRANGSPMLIDFGSSRHVVRGKDAGGPVALTPAYAAIEQYPGQGNPGAWTDIYSIGASLYRCISGRDPVDAMTRYQAIKQRKPDPLIPASELTQSGYSAYLRECIDWAMELEPSRRPQRAVELQDALMGKAPTHRKPKAPVTVTRSDAELAPNDAAPAPEPAKRLNHWRVIQVALVALILVFAFLTYNSYLDYKNRPQPVTTAAPVTTVPDVESASALDTPASLPRVAGLSEEVLFYPGHAIKLVRSLKGHRRSVNTLALLANGAQLASAGSDGAIKIWNAQDGLLLRTMRGQQRGINAIAASPEGSLLVSAGNEGALYLWDPSSGKRLARLTGHETDVFAMAYSADGRWLASAGRDRNIILWDMNKRRIEKNIQGHADSVLALAFSPKGSWLLSGGNGGQLKRWNVTTGKEVSAIESHLRKPVTAVAISPDGLWFASAGEDQQVRLWKTETEQQKRSFNGSPGTVNALAFTPDSRQLIAAGSDHTLRIWDVETGAVDHDLAGHEGAVQAVAIISGDQIIVSASKDNTVRVWKVEKKF